MPHLNRPSTIALGILPTLLFIAIACFAYYLLVRKIRARRAAGQHHLSAAAASQASSPPPGQTHMPVAQGILGYRIFRVDTQQSRAGWENWVHHVPPSVSPPPDVESVRRTYSL